MPSVISPFFERELKTEKERTAAFRAETERLGFSPALRPIARIQEAERRLPITEAPKAAVPYFPEGLRKGRLGNIMQASPEKLRKIWEKMPSEEAPIETIRGTERAYWSPGTRQEYGDLRTAMTGFKQQPAAARLAGAKAEDVEYETEFRRGARGTLEDILKSQAGLGRTRVKEAKLGVAEEERRTRLRDVTETMAAEAARPFVEEEPPSAPAKPGRKLRPELKKFLWSGWPEKGLPGLGAPVKGYYDIAKLLGLGAEEAYEYAFPRGK